MIARKPRFFTGWTVVSAAVLITFVQTTLFNPVLGIYIPEFQREFGWSRTEISIGVALGSLVSAFIAPWIGPMIDKHGGRIIVAVAAGVMSVCLLGLGLMQTLWEYLIIYAIGRGTAQGISNLTVSVTVSKWFIRRRGFAIGIALLGSRAGFAILPIAVQLIIDSSGWRESTFALAGIVAVLGIVPTLLWLYPSPESKGLLPDGDLPPTTTGQARGAPSYPLEENWSSADAVRTRTFWLVTGALCLQFFAGGAINLHQIPFMEDRGLSANHAALIISISALCSAAGTLLQGFLDLRFGTRKTLIAGFVGSSLGMIVLINVHSFLMGALYGLVYGLSFGLMVTSGQIIFAYYFGRLALGAIRGRAQPFQMVLNAAGPIIGGVAYDTTGSYLAAFIPFGFGYFIAAILLLLAKRPEAPSATKPLMPAA